MHSDLRVPSRTVPEGKVYTCFQTKRAQKPFPLGRHIHNYMAYIREYLPPPPSPGSLAYVNSFVYY